MELCISLACPAAQVVQASTAKIAQTPRCPGGLCTTVQLLWYGTSPGIRRAVARLVVINQVGPSNVQSSQNNDLLDDHEQY